MVDLAGGSHRHSLGKDSVEGICLHTYDAYIRNLSIPFQILLALSAVAFFIVRTRRRRQEGRYRPSNLEMQIGGGPIPPAVIAPPNPERLI